MTVDWNFSDNYPEVIIQKNNFINHQNNLWIRYPDCAVVTEKVNAINNWWGTADYNEIFYKFFCFFCSNFSGYWESILDFHPYAVEPFVIEYNDPERK